MHYNYKSDEKILKTLIHRNILPTDPNKKIKLIIYYKISKTSNLVIKNNSSPSIGVFKGYFPFKVLFFLLLVFLNIYMLEVEALFTLY